MHFEVGRKERDGVVILAPRGRLVLGEPVERLRAAFGEVTEPGRVRIALDLHEVDYIDSSALGCLVMAHTRVERAGGAMSLFGLNEKNVELLVITKLATVFRVADNEMDAVNLCFPERTARSFDVLDFVRRQRGGEGGNA